MKPDTLVTHAGLDPQAHGGIVNPPVYHCSTVLFPDVATVLETRKDRHSGEFREVTYGREGTLLTRAFEKAVASLEGAEQAVTLPCGMGAIADRKGSLYVAAGLNKPNPPFEPAEDKKGGIYVLSAEGKLLAFLPVPRDEVTNCAFGGDDQKTLYITAGGTLYSIRTTTQGRVVWPPMK